MKNYEEHEVIIDGGGGDPVRRWYIPLILGIIFIVLGIWVFLTPVASYITLSILFGATFLFTGLLEIIYAISNRMYRRNWGWALAGGSLIF